MNEETVFFSQCWSDIRCHLTNPVNFSLTILNHTDGYNKQLKKKKQISVSHTMQISAVCFIPYMLKTNRQSGIIL